jgi:hypothetical protein
MASWTEQGNWVAGLRRSTVPYRAPGPSGRIRDGRAAGRPGRSATDGGAGVERQFRRIAIVDPSGRHRRPAGRRRRQRLRAGGGDLFRRHQPGPQAAVRHPRGHDGGGGRRPPAAGALGRDAGRRDRGRLGRPPRRPPGHPGRHPSRGRCRGAASCPPTAPTSGPRGRCSRSRPRRSPARSMPPAATGRWCWPTSPASTARRSPCASCSSSTAPRSAARWSTSTAPWCYAWCRATTAARSWSSPATSTRTPRSGWSAPSRVPTPRSSPARRPPRWCSPARSTPAPAPTAAARPGGGGGRRRTPG